MYFTKAKGFLCELYKYPVYLPRGALATPLVCMQIYCINTYKGVPAHALISFFQQAHSVAGDTLQIAGKAQAFLCGCLYVHPIQL